MKKSLLIIIGMIFLVTLCAVSAEDISTNDTYSLDDSSSEFSYPIQHSDLDEFDTVSSTESSGDLKQGDAGTFDQLNQLVQSSSGTLVLDKDYKKTPDDTVGSEGITIGRGSSLETIDGNGHTLDASELGRIFNLDGGRKLVMKNITFINGKFDGDGGAVFADNVEIIFENCRFINNTAKDGGAVHTDATPTVKDCYFENNTADSSGGAMFVGRWGGFKVQNSTFVNNHANYKPEEYSSFSRYGGGAIYSKFSAVGSEIKDSTFINNTANYLGGAVNVQSDANSRDTIDITNSNFTGNKAASNGAVLLGTRFSNIDGCRFIDNHADETAGAVGIYNVVDTLTNSYFENNSAGRDGGAVFAFCYYSGLNSIDNITCINNSAGTYGGAVNAINTDISNSNFTDNKANDYGGAVVSYGTQVKDSTFENNPSGDGTMLVMNDGSDINYASSSQTNNDGLNDDTVSTDYTDRGILSPMSGYPPNVIWSDLGYVGFCCEKFYSQPYSGVVDHSLNVIDNNINGKPVAEYLKILLFTYFDGYNDFSKYSFPDYVWEFTDYDYENSDKEIVQNVIQLYNSGYRVPTENALKVLDDGSILRMDFLALDTADGEQDIFLFNWDTVKGDIQKESLNKTTFIGEKIDFNITVKNTGDAKLSNITVQDTDFSKELIYIGYRVVSGNWSYDVSEKVWKVGDLTKGQTATIILTFKSTTNGTFYNNATLRTKDMVLDNEKALTNVYTPQLFTKKISLNSTVFNGQIAEFVISLNNTGDYPLNNVFVEDIADEGLVYLRYVNGSRDWNYKNGKFYLVGVLAPNEVANLTVLFETTKSGNFTNTATGGSDETENHTWDDTVEVFSPKLSVQKITLNQTVSKGDTVEFKIVVTNVGDCNVSNIVIEEEAQDGLKYLNFKSDLKNLSYKDGAFLYEGTLAIDESFEFIVLFNATKTGNLTNTVKVHSDETDKVNASNSTNVTETNPSDDIIDDGSGSGQGSDNPIDDDTISNNTSNSTGNESGTPIGEDSISSNGSEDHDDDESVSDDEMDESSNKVSGTSGYSKAAKYNGDLNTGNPLLILLLVIVALCLEPFRRKR